MLYMAFLERPDLPRGAAGIPGLNPWNLLLINVCIAARMQMKRQKFTFQIPEGFKFLVIFYLFFIILAFLREVTDLKGVIEYSQAVERPSPGKSFIVMNSLLNPIKYCIPGLLLIYGCDSANRTKLALYAIAAANILVALQIIRIMPLSSLGASGTDMQMRAILKIDNRLGYFRSDVAIFLTGAAWSIFALQSIFNSKFKKLACIAAVGLIAFAIALTGGRAGQGVFLLLGAIFTWYKWRRLILLAPIGLIVLVTAVPTVLDRFTQGFEYDPDDPHFKRAATVEEGQMKSITSGRSTIWPYVIDGIFESPIIGHGGNAMQRNGISERLWTEHREAFPHPHNAYLQLFLDNGLLLGIPVLLLYFRACKRSFRLFRDKEDKLASAAGAACFAFIFSFLVGGIAQQSFYPPSSSVFVIAAIGIVIRLYYEKYESDKCIGQLETDENDTWNNNNNRLFSRK